MVKSTCIIIISLEIFKWVNYTLQKLIYESSPSKVSCYAVSIKMERLKLSYYTLLDACDSMSVCTHNINMLIKL